MPTLLKLMASVPVGDRNSWLSPTESKYATAWSRAIVDALYTRFGNVLLTVPPKKSGAAGSSTPMM